MKEEEAYILEIRTGDAGTNFVLLGKEYERHAFVLKLLGYVQFCYGFITAYPNEDSDFLYVLEAITILKQCCLTMLRNTCILGMHDLAKQCSYFLYYTKSLLDFPDNDSFFSHFILQFHKVMSTHSSI